MYAVDRNPASSEEPLRGRGGGREKKRCPSAPSSARRGTACCQVGIKLPSAAHPPLLTAAAEASCQTPAHWKTFVLRYKTQWLTAAHVVSSVVNLSSAWYCLHMATRLSEPSIPMRCSDSQRFPNSCVNWKQHSQLICFNRSLSNPHHKDTNQILSFF